MLLNYPRATEQQFHCTQPMRKPFHQRVYEHIYLKRAKSGRETYFRHIIEHVNINVYNSNKPYFLSRARTRTVYTYDWAEQRVNRIRAVCVVMCVGEELCGQRVGTTNNPKLWWDRVARWWALAGKWILILSGCAVLCVMRDDGLNTVPSGVKWCCGVFADDDRK